MTDFKLSVDSRKRIETMVRTNDGFEIAEVDMRLRGPGDIFGTQQSGMPIKFRIANLLTDSKILQVARMKAQDVLDDDPFLEKPENLLLAKAVEKEIMRSWSSVS
jgi:ATP-dependent DNA helicase RecG